MRNLALLTMVVFLLFMAGGVILPVHSLYIKSLGANYALIGALGTVGSVTGMSFSYVWGHASDRTRQRKRFLMIGLAGIALSRFLVAMAPSYVYVFPLVILAAIADSAYATSSLALMGDLLERERGRGQSMGIYRGLASLGFGLMAFVSGSIADRASLRAPFFVSGGLAAAAFVLAFTVHEPSPSEQGEARRAPGVTAKGSARRLPMAPLLVSAFLWSLCFSAVYVVWANYMVERLGYSQATMSRLWALASTSEFPFMVLAGWLSDRVGRLPMLSLGFLCWALVFVGYIGIPIMPWIVLIQLMRGFAYSAYTAPAMTYAAEVRSQAERGRASGLFNSAGGLGAIIGSVTGGALAQFVGFVPMIAICAALAFAGAVYVGGCALRWRASLRAVAEGSFS